jgi:hypothetical protein
MFIVFPFFFLFVIGCHACTHFPSETRLPTRDGQEKNPEIQLIPYILSDNYFIISPHTRGLFGVYQG